MPNQLYVPSEAALQLSADLARAVTGQLAGAYKHLKLPFTFATPDAAALFTVPSLPVGCAGLYIGRLFWEIITSFTGGASSAIGVSSTNAAYNTKGDLLGGAGGDVATTLVSTGPKYKGGTLGAKFGTNGIIVLVPGDVIRFDRVVSAFTAGAGNLHIDIGFVD